MTELVTRSPIELSWKDKHRIKEIMGIMQAVEGRRRQMIDFRSGLQRLAPSAIPSFYSLVSPTQDTKISRLADILKVQVSFGSMRNMLRGSNMKNDLNHSLRPQSAAENLITRFQPMVPVPNQNPLHFKVVREW